MGDRPMVALLAVGEATAATLYGLYDLFSSAGRDWEVIMHGRSGSTALEPRIVSASGAGFRTSNGAWVQPDLPLVDCPRPDLVCIPDLALSPEDAANGEHREETAWLRQQLDAGAIVAAACTGSFLLAEAGLLQDRDATTHWAFCDSMAQCYPDIRVHPQRALVATGPGQRIVMGGGGTSWLDLALYLVGRLVSIEEAMHLARLYLIAWHGEGQRPYAAISTTTQQADAVIARCQLWAASHYDTPAPVTEMLRLSGLNERSFKRRFKQATGMTPLDYIHTLRIEEAKQMLEAGDDRIEAVAEAVGYEDASFFRRLFRRQVGLTPTDYRRRFRGLRLVIETAAS